MCNEDAQSIEAPPSILPTRTAELKEVPCPLRFALSAAQTLPDSLFSRVRAVSHDKSLAGFTTLPRRSVSPRLPVPSRSAVAARPGFPEPLYRPPRL